MGCDIHLVIEQRWKDRWVGIGRGSHCADDEFHGASLSRNYHRFAQLAGVTGEGPKPKGIPEDISDLTKIELDRWEGDGHSYSWLSLIEAAKIWAETSYEKYTRAKTDPIWYYFAIEDFNNDYSNYRIIFWFDN